MTPSEIDELERLEQAATPGEWEALDAEPISPSFAIVTDMFPLSEAVCPAVLSKQDADFIAALRNAAPSLLKMARELLDRKEMSDNTTLVATKPEALALIAAAKLAADQASAFGFQPEPHTKGKPDKWTILAIRILSFGERDDVADGLDAEMAALTKLAAERKAALSDIFNEACLSRVCSHDEAFDALDRIRSQARAAGGA